MLQIVLIIFVALIVGVLLYASTKPDTFTVQRSLTIHAPADRLFSSINDFRVWHTWSPYEKLDTNMKKTFGGSANGTGATYLWEGNSKVGQGQMEIIQSLFPTRVDMTIDFIKPFKDHGSITFTLEPKDDLTTVTWSMSGKKTFVSKVICIFINIDAKLGKDFDTGLATLKTVSEKN